MTEHNPSQDNEPGYGWFTRRALAELLGLSDSYFRGRLVETFPPNAVHRRKRPKPTLYHGRTIVEIWARRALLPKLQRDDAESDTDREPSPIERVRIAQAEELEMKNEVRRGQLVNVDRIREFSVLLASHIRRAGETLKRSGNTAGHEVLEEALDDVERVIEERFDAG